MKLVTFTVQGRTRLGEVVGDTVYTMAWADGMTSLIRRGILPSRTWESFPLNSVTLEAPLRPGKVVAIGLNYAEHARETGKEPPAEPVVFGKNTTAVIGINQPITWHTSEAKEVDFEGELAVVIGKKAQRVAEADALDYVFGYTIGNDVSARDLQKEQWLRAKGMDTFCPLGPLLVTKDEVPDPQALTIQTKVNGMVMQDGSTADMIQSVRALIAYLSRYFTLEPGDVIMTGTPPGVGKARKPPVYLHDGDTVEITINGLGTLVNPCREITE